MTSVAVPVKTGRVDLMYAEAEQDSYVSSAMNTVPQEKYVEDSRFFDKNGKKCKMLEHKGLPSELISLSFDLLNEVHNQIQGKNGAHFSYLETSSEISEQEYGEVSDIALSTVSMTADSSSSELDNFNNNEIGDNLDSKGETDGSSSIDSNSGVSSPQSPRQFRGCPRNVNSRTGMGQGRQLYTAELQVLCRICGDRASGFHYGVHSCEGCKGFFRRTLKKQLVYKPCRDGSHCSIDTGTRNKCQYCRYQKCLKAGMSQNAVRFGRMPKVEREKLVADKEELKNTCSKRILELRSLSDSIRSAFLASFSGSKLIQTYLNQPALPVTHIKVDPDNKLTTAGIDEKCFRDREIFKNFQEVIIPLIEGTVRLTKKLPEFSDLPMNERIVLLKQNCFCVVLVLSSMMYEESALFLESNSVSLSILKSGLNYGCQEAECLLEGIFSIGKKLKAMNLKLTEVALFCSILLLVESPGITCAAQVERLQMELINSLRLELKHNHPKDKLMLPRLLVLIPQLVQTVEEFRQNASQHVFDSSFDFRFTHDLLTEIFDLQ